MISEHLRTAIADKVSNPLMSWNNIACDTQLDTDDPEHVYVVPERWKHVLYSVRVRNSS